MVLVGTSIETSSLAVTIVQSATET